MSDSLIVKINMDSHQTSHWASDPVIAMGVGAHDVDLNTVRIGDGSSKYSELPVFPLQDHVPPHSENHASGGVDEITPNSIGAAEETHSHTPAEIGAAPESHDHDYIPSGSDGAAVHLVGTVESPIDLNTITGVGVYFIEGTVLNGPTIGPRFTLLNEVSTNGGSQLIITEVDNSPQILVRTKSVSSWDSSEWSVLITDKNIATFAPRANGFRITTTLAGNASLTFPFPEGVDDVLNMVYTVRYVDPDTSALRDGSLICDITTADGVGITIKNCDYTQHDIVLTGISFEV